MTIAIMLLGFLANANADLCQEFSFGYIPTALDAARTPQAAKQLQLEREQLLEIGRLHDALKNSARMVEIRSKTGEVSRSSSNLKKLYADFSAERNATREFNRLVLERIDEVLDDAEKSRQFRSILTVFLLQVGSVEGVLRLHDVKISEDKFALLLKRKAQRREKASDPSRRQYEISLRIIGATLTEEQMSKAMGKEYSAKLPGENNMSFGNPIHQYYRDAALQLVYDAQVQEDLGMTVGQVSKLTAARRNLESRFSESVANRIAFRGQNPESITEALVTLRTDLDNELPKYLTPVQVERLRQLLFQLYVRRMEHGWALRYSGKQPPGQTGTRRRSEPKKAAFHTAPDVRNRISYEARYATKAINIRDHMRMLVEIVGRDKALQLCGAPLTLPVSTTRDKPGNEEARKLVEGKYLSEFRGTNRRRLRNQ